MNIPRYLQEKLSAPTAGEGGRHEDIKELAWQLIGEENTREECFELLRARYPRETTGKPDGEIYRAIDGAIRKDPQPAGGALSGNVSGKSWTFGNKAERGGDGKLVIKR